MGLQRALDCTWSGRLSSVGRNDRTLFPFAEYLQSSHICRMLPGPKETLIYDQRYAKGDSPLVAQKSALCGMAFVRFSYFPLRSFCVLFGRLVAAAGYRVLVLHHLCTRARCEWLDERYVDFASLGRSNFWPFPFSPHICADWCLTRSSAIRDQRAINIC